MTEPGASPPSPPSQLGPRGPQDPEQEGRLGGLSATAWAAGTLLGGWDLCQLAAGAQSQPGVLAWTAIGLLFAAGVFAILRPPANGIPQSAALITSAGWTCALVAGRMANSLAGGEAVFVLGASLTCALTGSLASLVSTPQTGPPAGPSFPALLRRGGVTLLILAGCFLGAWILGAGRYRPALRLAVLPPTALVIGLAPGAAARTVAALGVRLAAAVSALLEPPSTPQPPAPSGEPARELHAPRDAEPQDGAQGKAAAPKPKKPKKVKP